MMNYEYTYIIIAMKKTNQKEFWITNISNRNVSLSDLNLSIRAYSSVNLMDKRHYSYSLEELEKSLASGSLYKKRDKLVKRVVPPNKEKSFTSIDRETAIPSKPRSILEIKEEKIPELEFTDEQYNAQLGEDESPQK